MDDEKAGRWVTVLYHRRRCGMPARSLGPNVPFPDSSKTSRAAHARAISAMVGRSPARSVLRKTIKSTVSDCRDENEIGY